MMLTDLEMLEIAKQYLERMSNNSVEAVILPSPKGVEEKEYGNLYYYNSKKFLRQIKLNIQLWGMLHFWLKKQGDELLGLELVIV